MATVWLGNRSAVEVTYPEDEDGTRLAPVRTVLPPAKRCTTVEIPAGWSLMETMTTLLHPTGGTWVHHADEPPAWVASTDPALASALAAHWGCELREPEPGV
jgi:hypothetical protein